ncbi:hypothetical protein HZI73_16760 [Vallitalea pronyensis]|uniref:Uncharacterized protein n=1 Tax=Vallitalea pronyensis TaxID=1348613 RepID=A0A8J8MM80_9FIRM|nr:hypothetical protein [Vallitalea pronyensis]QUI23843.1 hypothetical protein HZI73_16760 [Vallitalea pronyensis]
MRNLYYLDFTNVPKEAILGHPISTSLYLAPILTGKVNWFTNKEKNTDINYHKYNILSLEETLLNFLRDDENYNSHFIGPLLRKWHYKLDYDKIFKELNNNQTSVLLSIMYLCNISSKEIEILCKKYVNIKRHESKKIFYPSYMEYLKKVIKSYSKLYIKAKDKLVEIRKEFNVDLYMTKSDLKIIPNKYKQNFLMEDIAYKVFNKLIEIHTFFKTNNIKYALGGSLALFSNHYLDTSTDIDVIVIGDYNEIIFDIFAEKLNLKISKQSNDYITFNTKDDLITIDIDINQHYIQKITNDIHTKICFVNVYGRNIPTLLPHEIIRLKSNYGRLKDFNMLFKFLEFKRVSITTEKLSSFFRSE